MEDKIKVLSVGSLGRRNKISPFRLEQGESLRKFGIDVDYFNIKGQGFLGYLRNLPNLRKKIDNFALAKKALEHYSGLADPDQNGSQFKVYLLWKWQTEFLLLW